MILFISVLKPGAFRLHDRDNCAEITIYAEFDLRLQWNDTNLTTADKKVGLEASIIPSFLDSADSVYWLNRVA